MCVATQCAMLSSGHRECQMTDSMYQTHWHGLRCCPLAWMLISFPVIFSPPTMEELTQSFTHAFQQNKTTRNKTKQNKKKSLIFVTGMRVPRKTENTYFSQKNADTSRASTLPILAHCSLPSSLLPGDFQLYSTVPLFPRMSPGVHRTGKCISFLSFIFISCDSLWCQLL